jgi:diguanylate cyclase (GGDEF)-like protein
MQHEARWRDLLTMAADMAFETDGQGRLTFLMPEDVLGWRAEALIGQPAAKLLATPASADSFDPFGAHTPVRGRRVWLNRAGGGHACLRFTCTPLLDATGRRGGTRGIGLLEPEAGARLFAANETAIDSLTGLLNRPAFLGELARRLDRLEIDGEPGTLMCADLDRFTALNATLGPALGDTVLASVAALLTSTLRPEDLIGRLEGDSFGLWMSGADHMTAAERAETLRTAVPELVAVLAGPDAPPVSISIGIASHNQGTGETVGMLMRRAGRAMDAVKQGGRGHWRVALAGQP